MTGMTDMAWQAAADKGAHVSLVVTLMERSNVDTVFVAGRVKKWHGELPGFDLKHLRSELEASRES
jgi:cytosine/adenosine deaminase-related metal-dependent hydrolase